MKTSTLRGMALVCMLMIGNFAFAAPVIKSVKDGFWNQASTWSLNRLPQTGDTIVVTAGTTVTVNGDENITGAGFLQVYGKFTFQGNNSTLSLGTNSFIWVFTGGQISGGGSASQKLRINGVLVFDGATATINGPQMASSSTTGFVPMSNGSTLPVKFVGFTLMLKGTDVLIQWSTSEEINAGAYEVERSVDGSNWNTVSYQKLSGNSSSLQNYSYTDKNITAKLLYYRIKETDVNGISTTTSIKSIKTDVVSTSTDIKVAAINNKVLLQFPSGVSGNMQVRFVSITGQVVDVQTISNPVGQAVINSKVRGNYIISISNGQEINIAKQVIL